MIKYMSITLMLMLLVGCNGWLSKPVDPIVSGVVETAQSTKSSLQSAIDESNRQPSTTDADKAMLARLGASLAKVDGVINKANTIIAGSQTNGDAVLASIGALAAAFGVPFIGLGVQVLRKSKLVRAYETGIVNLDKHRDGNTVNFDALKIDNADAGINSIIDRVRAG